MRELKNAKLTTLTLSEIERLKADGWVPLAVGDASKANSDYFAVMVRDRNGARDVMIVCPSFLRGPLSMMSVHGNICY
jgi:hypothetical protein